MSILLGHLGWLRRPAGAVPLAPAARHASALMAVKTAEQPLHQRFYSYDFEVPQPQRASKMDKSVCAGALTALSSVPQRLCGAEGLFLPKKLMMKFIPRAAARLLFPVLVAGAALAATSCSKDEPPVAVVQQDFSAADDATIQKYLADNKITNAKKQPSGLYYIPVITNPNGAQATAGRKVSVLYTGTLLDGTVFDATSQRNNTPFAFTLGIKEVIAGWDEGIALMKKNEKSILLIPSGLAYGAQSRPPTIIPNSILRFEVELTNIQ